MALFLIWLHWSHLVTLVTVEVNKDLNNDGLDGYFGSMVHNWELFKSKRNRGRNA